MRQRVVHAAPLGRWVDPALVYRALCGDADDAFWLDSGPDAVAGTSAIGRAAQVVTAFPDGVLPFLRSLDLDAVAPSNGVTLGPTFTLGWVGWLGYEVRGESMGAAVEPDPRHPVAAWLRIDRAVVFDHAARQVTLLAFDDVQGWRREVEAALAAEPAAPNGMPPIGATDLAEASAPGDAVPGGGAGAAPAVWAHDDERYLAMIRDCQAAIRDGDAYQLCLTTAASVAGAFDPVATYLALRASSPSHHGALIRAGGVSLLSASPERFLAVGPAGLVTTSPIKGTRPRGVDAASDADLAAELLASDKERAENVMIVDLMRNDLARIAQPGSVRVTELLAVESYAQVHQLVSTVTAQLAAGRTAVDAIEACFPAGSMTGAPKRSATDILARLEGRPRGVYSGVFGYLGADGAVDLAMVIRSIVLDAAGATVGAGGGITALSVPAEELAEVKLKAAALLRVLGALPVERPEPRRYASPS